MQFAQPCVCFAPGLALGGVRSRQQHAIVSDKLQFPAPATDAQHGIDVIVPPAHAPKPLGGVRSPASHVQDIRLVPVPRLRRCRLKTVGPLA
jgi:hypothetical protein